ncbi:MAG: hypothetical protein H0U20_00450, partial [Thermoleophilaceae bacterium]|nr:hypothetical protein [Thermoleophilaceae bacterium]
NSGADGWMADFEDSLSPTWANLVAGQANLIEANRGTLEFEDDGGVRTLNEETATILVRPRGWHLHEKHVHVDGTPISGGLFDFGLYLFHNARQLLDDGSGPYFYLPKMESHLEARLWNEVFVHAQEALGIDHGAIRATVLIEAVLPALLLGVERKRSPDGIHQVRLAADHVGPGGRVGVLEVGHEAGGPGVQGVDHHLGAGGTGDLHPPLA